MSATQFLPRSFSYTGHTGSADSAKDIQAVIFDGDGTIVDSVEGHAFCATQKIFRENGVQNPPSLRTYLAEFGPPFTDFYYRYGVPTSFGVKDIWARYRELTNFEEQLLFEGVADLIRHLRESAFEVSLVTSQNMYRIQEILKRNGYKNLFPPERMFCDAMPNKVEFMRKAVEAMRLEPRQVIAVGDMVSDTLAATQAGIPSAGLLPKGLCKVEELFLARRHREAGAIATFHNLDELLDFLN